MVYLFSSSYYQLYQKDVLNACCYPEGHVMRLRYSEGYVADSVKLTPTLMVGENGLFVFADPQTLHLGLAKTDQTRAANPPDFVFYPIREIQIINVQILAG